MTIRKYKRLCLVAFVPLLLLGLVVFKFLIPYPDKYANITCEADSVFGENCRNVGDSDGGLYKRIIADHPDWVGATVGDYKEDAFLYDSILITSRVIENVSIVNAEPFASQGVEVKNSMKTLIDLPAHVSLESKPSLSKVFSDHALLSCNELNIKDDAGMYSANCWGDGWGGSITFLASSDKSDPIEVLRSDLLREVHARESDYLLFRIITYPLFIYLFLIISGLTWLLMQAVAFVRRG